MTDRVTRLAPSPTGALHLGNMRTFLINWAAARQAGWGIVLRIEDLDGPRVKAEASQQAIDVLQWLGMDWDGQTIYQSHDLSPYEIALDTLSRQGLTYPCPATRSEILAAASAPNEGDHEQRYPGLYRPVPGKNLPRISEEADTAIRVIVPDGEIGFVDELLGPQAVNVQQQVGDFIVQTKAGLPSYQLAVVVDDARQGVTDIVRGDDLLRSSARQVLLQRSLDLGSPPRYFHVPLVYGEDGHRLAKRHGDTRAAMYREYGIRPERLVGLLAWWCGFVGSRNELSAAEFLAAFDWAKLSPDSITFSPEDHQWLMQNA